MNFLLAIVFIKYSKVNRYGFASLCGHRYCYFVAGLFYRTYCEIGTAIFEEPFLPKPIQVPTSTFVHTIEKIIRHRVFAMPLFNIMMQGFREQSIAEVVFDVQISQAWFGIRVCEVSPVKFRAWSNNRQIVLI